MSSAVIPPPLDEARVRELGTQLVQESRVRRASFWAREHWEETLLSKLMANDEFRVQALRFVDVLPVLRDDAELVRLLQEYFADDDLPLPGVARWGLDNSRGTPAQPVLAAAVRTALHAMSTRFIGGADAREVGRTLDHIRREGMGATLDLLGEASVSETEAAAYTDQYVQMIRDLAPRVERWSPAPLLDRIGARRCPRLNVSVKVSSLFSQLSPLDPAGSAREARPRLAEILRTARSLGAFVCLDMEQYDFKEILLHLFRETLMDPEFRDWPDIGIALQAYLRDTEADLVELIQWARRRGTPVTVRLVRGAYWDYETVVARQNHWPIPVWEEKWQTDRNYERCLKHLFDNHPHVEAAVASHNARSLAVALTLAEQREMPPDAYEVQMLYGMADPLKDAVERLGRRVRVYVPFGAILPGMSYLVRRLLENTARESFLRMGFGAETTPENLLAPPRAPMPIPAEPNSSPERTPSVAFVGEPVRRFTEAAERDRFAAALGAARERLGQEYPLFLHGRRQFTGSWVTSVNPARPSEIVGKVAAANESDAEAAIKSACAAFPAWTTAPMRERSDFLRRAAGLLRRDRDLLAAWQVLEAGKPWREADADVVEAIDFLEYYAAQAEQYAEPRWFNVPGETNAYFYQGRGVAVVISPWNFPLAILTGMLAAAVVTGNTAVVKPAPQTPITAVLLMERLLEAGLPDGVINLLPSSGAEVGEYLVRHPRTHLIAFTGSRSVGSRIFRVAAELADGQTHLKRVIAEMGGKNTLIVDSSADLDEAVLGCLGSAFGFSGQKCSAASRAVVIGSAYEPFLRRLTEAADSIRLGFPEDPFTTMGPVIDSRARHRIRTAVENARPPARLVYQTPADVIQALGDGYFVGPTIFADVPPTDPLSQEELFGPVLAVARAGSFDEALDLALGTDYALTGGLYSRSPEHLAQAARDFRVGNLYLNRKITGAIVGRQPFGGFKMSGVGSKAGGPDYLLQFMEPRTVTESTLRRGFAPDS